MGAAFAVGNDGAVITTDGEAVHGQPHERETSQESLSWAERPASRRSTVLSFSGLVASALFAALTVIPSPYAIGNPGPTIDTLGTLDGTPVVSITGAPTFPTTGELRLTTVSESRAGSQVFTLGEVIGAYFSRSHTVLPQEVIFGAPDEREQRQELSAQQWITSQEKATVSALEALGTQVPATLTVAGIGDTSHAQGVLQEGDVIVSVGGKQIVGYSDLFAMIETYRPGDMLPVAVRRNGALVETQVELSAGGDGTPLIGILVDPEFDLPIDVTVAIETVGGPSAGTMFALAIMDMLTEEDELQGAHVAGTGTIDVRGEVGAIGGVRLKMVGAKNAGAEHFLVPVANCGEVVGHIPPGLSVYAVKNLAEAYEAIVAIGRQDTAGLATCSNS